MVKNLNKILEHVLPNNAKTRDTYTNNKNISSTVKIKDKTSGKHKRDLIFYAKCSKSSCTEDYLGETGGKIIERTGDHDGEDKQSHLLNYALTQNHRHFDLHNMEIIDFSFLNNKLKRKIS